MAGKLTLRMKLLIWYSIVLAVSIGVFGVYVYLSVSKGLNSSLDSSLNQVGSSMEYIVSKYHISDTDKFINADDQKTNDNIILSPFGPDLSGKISQTKIWDALYEHILLNPKNYFIQIADTTNKIIWRSSNLKKDSLPIMATPRQLAEKKKNKKDFKLSYDALSNILYSQQYKGDIGDSVFASIKLNGKDVRLHVKRSDEAIISLGYTLDDVKYTLNGLLDMLLIAVPLILVVSVSGGIMLTNLSLRSIDDITTSAQKITANNLSNRLPSTPADDEIGRLTTTLNEMIERLEKSFSQTKQFTSDASHELKTPLTILRGELELALITEKSPEEYQRVLESSLEEVIRLTNVAETLLELSRADTGQVKMNFEKANLTKLVAEIAEDAEILAEIKDINVCSILQKDISIDLDQPRMHQAILNIVENAIKYTENGGTVIIELLQRDTHVELTVTDTGIGIPEDKLKDVFKRFYRVNKKRTHSIQGNGLGLSIVKWIVNAHNGKIDIQSKVKKGTKMIIQLPFSIDTELTQNI